MSTYTEVSNFQKTVRFFLAHPVHIPFFGQQPTGQTLPPILTHDDSKDAITQGCAFWGLQKLKVTFNAF